MRIGTFGDVEFEVSPAKILTFNNWQRTTKHRFQKHDILNHKPKLESVGAELEELTLEIYLSAYLNADPRAELKKLRRMVTTGEVNYLIIGGEVIGECLWVIEEIGEAVETWSPLGQALNSRVTVKFREYNRIGDY